MQQGSPGSDIQSGLRRCLPMANHTVLLEDRCDVRLEPRLVWLLRQYRRREDQQRNRWRRETQGGPNYWRKRTGVHCTGSIIRGECTTVLGRLGCPSLACIAQLIWIGHRFQIQRPAAIRDVTSLRSPHFAGFNQNAIHIPTTGDRPPV